MAGAQPTRTAPHNVCSSALDRADLAAHAEDSGHHEGSVRGFYG